MTKSRRKKRGERRGRLKNGRLGGAGRGRDWHWAPLKDPEYLEPGHKKIDIVARFGTFCNAYGMNRADRKKVIDGAVISLDMGLQAVRERMKRDFLYQILWLRDYEGINRRSRSWLERNREVLITAP